jgi:3'-5' exoribonuclease
LETTEGKTGNRIDKPLALGRVTAVAKTLISEILPNQEVASSFVIEDKQLRVARNGTPFLTLKLVDKSGQITGRIWERAEEWSRLIEAKSVVFIRGKSEVFREELQLQIEEIAPVPPADIDRADFLPVCPKSLDELMEKLRDLAATIKKGPLQRLARQILSDTHLMDRFKAAPAAKSMHHAYLGGLLEHTVAVAELVSSIAVFYPELNRDLLVIGAILHDIGKVDEFTYDLFIDYSPSGRLLGHMVLGVQILDERIRSLRGFPSEEALLLSHLILSHHGEVELGAVRLPMTREAFVLHFADDLDAKMNSLTRILADSKQGDEAWTPYQPLFERFFFRGFPVPAGSPNPTALASDKEQGIQLNLWSAGKRREDSA